MPICLVRALIARVWEGPLLTCRWQIKTTQDIATLIRDLQELWLFGGLDTLQNPADEEAQRKKAEEVASIIEVLAQQKPGAELGGHTDGSAAA